MVQDVQNATGAGPRIAAGSRVVLVVSQGPVPGTPTRWATTPNLGDAEQGTALERVESASLNAQVFTTHDAVVRRGHVIDQFPPPGAAAPLGSDVVVLVSTGPSEVGGFTNLPDAVGLGESEAVSRLREASLEPDVARDYHPNVALGVVIAQLPSQPALAAEKPRNRMLRWVWIGLAFLLAILVAAAAFTLLVGKTAQVPDVTGLNRAGAVSALNAVGLRLGTVTQQSGSTAAEGSVISQAPQAGVQLRNGSAVSLVVAAAKPRVSVPSVVGLSEADAASAIRSAGLTVQEARKYSDSVPAGSVIDQAPASGAQAEKAAAITITISQGPQSTNVKLPDFVGLTEAAATAKAESLQLSARISNEYSSSVAAGLVSGQIPDMGQSVAPGTTVGLSVSLGPAPNGTISVPDLKGQTSANANAALSALGLTSALVQWDRTGEPADTVIGQSPKAAEQVAPGSTIVVFVSSGK